MHIDVPTLYCLTVGTLCVAVAMTVWERRAAAHRTRELGIWAAAYTVLAVGCGLMFSRPELPGALGSAMANVVIVTGYFGLLWGAASFDGRRAPRWPLAVIAATAFAWAIFGARHETLFWNHLGSVPIAIACGATAWTILVGSAAHPLRSRPLAATVIGGHGLFYLGRATIFPLLVATQGDRWLPIFATATMFEAVLYAVAMPMALLALVREETVKRLIAASETDFLTNVDNRRAFTKKASKLVGDDASALVVFDLDHFKMINDRHGHATGDEVLKTFCRVVEGEMSTGDVFGRLGGEEFAVVFRGYGAEDARRLAIAISRLYTAEVSLRFPLSLRATVSAGIAQGRAHVELAQLLGEADGALYRAKKAGRDQALIAETLAVVAPAVAEPRAA